MQRVNFSLNGLKGLTPSTKKQEDKKAEETAEKALDKVVQKAVEKAVEMAKSQTSLLETDIKLDTVEISVKKDEIKVSVEKPEPKSANPDPKGSVNPDEPVNVKADKQVKFGSLTSPSVGGTAGVNEVEEVVVDRTRNLNDHPQFEINPEYLLNRWTSFIEENPNATYEQKLAEMDRIIRLAGNSENVDLANTWRCYKFMLVNNYLKDRFVQLGNQMQIEYNNEPEFVITNPDGSTYSFELPITQGEQGVSYDDLGFNPEDGWVHSTGVIYDFSDYEEIKYFGGHVEGEGINAHYVPNGNDLQRYIYSEAMYTVYTTKRNAIRMKMLDPDIQNNSMLMGILQRNLLYFETIIRNIQVALEEIRENLRNNYNGTGYGEYMSIMGLTASDWPITDPHNTLIIPGLMPPVEQVNIGTGLELPESDDELADFYDALVNKYDVMFGETVNNSSTNVRPTIPDTEMQIAMLQALIEAARRLGRNDKVAEWQAILSELTGIGNGNGNGIGIGVGADPILPNIFNPTHKNESNEVFTKGAPLTEEDLPDEVFVPLEETDAVPVKEEKTGVRAFGTAEEDDKTPEELEFYSMFDEYNSAQNEYKQDLLKLLINFVCKMIDKDESGNNLFWRSQLKILLNEWDRNGWEPFVRENNLQMPV